MGALQRIAFDAAETCARLSDIYQAADVTTNFKTFVARLAVGEIAGIVGEEFVSEAHAAVATLMDLAVVSGVTMDDLIVMAAKITSGSWCVGDGQ